MTIIVKEKTETKNTKGTPFVILIDEKGNKHYCWDDGLFDLFEKDKSYEIETKTKGKYTSIVSAKLVSQTGKPKATEERPASPPGPQKPLVSKETTTEERAYWEEKEKKGHRAMCVAYAKDLAVGKNIGIQSILETAEQFFKYIQNGLAVPNIGTTVPKNRTINQGINETLPTSSKLAENRIKLTEEIENGIDNSKTQAELETLQKQIQDNKNLLTDQTVEALNYKISMKKLDVQSVGAKEEEKKTSLI